MINAIHRTFRLPLIVLSFTMTTFTCPTYAQWVVSDPGALAANVAEFGRDAVRFGKTAAHYGQVIQHYQKQIEHYQQQLIKLQNLGFTMPTLPQVFVRRDDNWGVSDKCLAGGSGSDLGNIAAGLLKQALPSITDDISDTQKTICAQIQQLENRKYNETVDIYNYLRSEQDAYASINQQRNRVGTSQGAMAANDNEVAKLSARIGNKVSAWQISMSTYDAYIGQLRQQQRFAVKHAFSGKNTLGQLINAATLKIALSQ